MNREEILLQDRFEKRFGKTFKVDLEEIYEFIEDEVDNGITDKEIAFLMFKLYRDDTIDIKSLKKVIEYLGGTLPPQMEYHGEDAKKILRDIASKVESEPELMRRLYQSYQNDRISLDYLRLCVTLMGYRFDDEFDQMEEGRKKKAQWVYNDKGEKVLVEDEVADFVKCFTGIINVDNDGLFIPTFKYFSPIDFVDDYMKQNNIKKSVLSKTGIDRRYKSGLKKNGVKKKIDAYRFIIAISMTTQIAKQFLTLCGFSFSPLQKIDLFMLDYLNGKCPKVASFKEFAEKYNNLFVEAYGEVFDWPYYSS